MRQKVVRISALQLSHSPILCLYTLHPSLYLFYSRSSYIHSLLSLFACLLFFIMLLLMCLFSPNHAVPVTFPSVTSVFQTSVLYLYNYSLSIVISNGLWSFSYLCIYSISSFVLRPSMYHWLSLTHRHRSLSVVFLVEQEGLSCPS